MQAGDPQQNGAHPVCYKVQQYNDWSKEQFLYLSTEYKDPPVPSKQACALQLGFSEFKEVRETERFFQVADRKAAG